jgi:predicted Zn-dependent protease
VSRGLLQLVNSEDELACVVGHEITHAAERHAAGRQEYTRRMNPFAIGWVKAGHVAAYGRDQERDADRGGQIIASRAGYDPMGMAEFLHSMDAMDRLKLGWSRRQSFFASHPATPERAATAANRAQTLLWQPRQHITATHADFLHQLENLVLGPDPKGGIFREQRFLHPDMNFSMRFPDGWMLINTHQAVGAVEPSGRAMVSLKVAGAGDDPVAVAHAFMEGEMKEAKASVSRAGPVQIGDLPGYRVEGEGRMGGVKTGGHITFIAHEGMVYRIDVVSRAKDAAKFAGRTRVVARSFRPLTDEEKGSFEITRLRVVRAQQGERLDELSQRTGNALRLGTTAVLNGIFINSGLAGGQLIKVGISEPYVPERRQPPTENEPIETGVAVD